MSNCICEFSGSCYGTGVIDCSGCGGDFCVCRSCFGGGSMECPGCVDCNFGEFDDPTYCPQCNGIGEARCNCQIPDRDGK